MTDVLLSIVASALLVVIYYLRRLCHVVYFSNRQSSSGKLDENGRKQLMDESKQQIDEL